MTSEVPTTVNRPTTSPRPHLLTRLYRRFGSLGHELSGFAAVGAVAYLVDTGLFNLAHYGWHTDVFSAKIISTVVAASLAFLGNRFWTWRHRPRSALHREYLWYFTFNAIGLGINLCFVALYELAVRQWPAQLDNPIALNLVVNVLGVGLASAFRFYAYRTWVFGPDEQARPGQDSREQ